MKEHGKEIPEEPATHKKKAQAFLFVLLGILVLALIFDVVRKSSKEEEKPAEEKTVALATTPSSAVEIQTFEERVKQAAQQRAEEERREAEETNGAPAKGRGRVQQILDQLQERNAALGSQDPAGGTWQAGYGLGGVVPTEKSPEEEFRRKETARALNSRKAPLIVDLGGDDSKQQPKAEPPATQETGGFEAKQNYIKEELARARALQERLLKNLDGGGGERLGMTALAGGRSATQITAQTTPELEVGQPVVEQQEGPKPGQVLLATGTVISAVLDQMAISDYMGSYRALVTQDVYDPSGQYILAPKGAKIVGKTIQGSAVNEAINNRMAMTVNWLILPNGKRVNFQKTAALDAEGVGALRDKVSYHLIPQILGVAAYASLSSTTSRSGSGANSDTTYEGELGENLREQFAPLAAKFLNLVPTVTLRQGTPMRIFVEDDLYITPWAHVYEGIMSRERG